MDELDKEIYNTINKLYKNEPIPAQDAKNINHGTITTIGSVTNINNNYYKPNRTSYTILTITVFILTVIFFF